MLQSILRTLLGLLVVGYNWVAGLNGGWLPALPHVPHGERLNLRDFVLTWNDEFDGDSLDATKWRLHSWDVKGVTTIHRQDGFWNLQLATVQNGQLHIASKYLEQGLDDKPAGWYSAGIDSSGLFAQRYGYFEVRAKMPKGEGLWSAFWMLNNAGMQNTPDGNGRDGMEIDVMESPYWFGTSLLHPKPDRPFKNSTLHTLHYDGYSNGTHKSEVVKNPWVWMPYDNFHTYGVRWSPEEFVFFIDGIESGRSTFGGVSQVPEYLLLSVEHQFGGWAGDIRNNKTPPTDFVVDYVRVYQYK